MAKREAEAAAVPELGYGDVYVYAHGNGAIFVMDDAHRTESMTLEDVLLLTVSCRQAGYRVVAGWDPAPVALDVITRIRAIGATFVEFTSAPPQTWQSGTTALMEAASAGWQRLLDDLIARGLPIDERDESGSTALHHAAGKGHIDAVESLVAAGAELDRPNRPGLTPYWLAMTSGHTALGNRLAALGASTADSSEMPLRFSRAHFAVAYVWVALAVVMLAMAVPLTWASAGWLWAVVAFVAISAAYRLLWPSAFWAGGVPRRLDGAALTLRRISGRAETIDLGQVTIAGLGGSRRDRRKKPLWMLIAHPAGHPVTSRALRRLMVEPEEVEQLVAGGDRFVVVVLDGGHADEVLLPVGNLLDRRRAELTPSFRRQLLDARTQVWAGGSR